MTPTDFSRRQWVASAVTSSLLWHVGARASAYPERTVRIVVPFAAGAGTDAMGRLLAQKLSDLLGASVVVENRTGASGAIGTQHVAQSVPDGYTLLLVAAPFTTVSAVLPSAGYDPVTSFTPISMVAQGPLMWACNKDLPVQTLAELVAYAKARPGQLNYGSAGAGGINHLVLEQLKARTGVSIVHIPYRGIAPATLDMIGGQIHLITGTIPALAPFVRDGRIKPLAVTTSQRHQALPQVPGLLELGLADLVALNYFGLVAPKSTPLDVTERLAQAIGRISAMPDVQARFRVDALEVAPLGSSYLERFIRTDLDAWKKVVQQQGIKIDQL
ncbi:twin-arginine translocation pathway signal protein [Limnohabitans sp. 2KL-1]|uniref:Bug family tripartite tricarboxylate transporter substrate binding protein n=1 Tax=Limnohabitans sp. 2KL-1 TaxID=1100699 RepID=UPI000D3CF0BB|nr:tripartite tricarboxylate transporter substrate binding protein [Limnohabitans sp. 2KL-1]PUE46699.1 twin-arginine translocation pathway signal protein [Limnohabitans sp. 2KL-1]